MYTNIPVELPVHLSDLNTEHVCLAIDLENFPPQEPRFL